MHRKICISSQTLRPSLHEEKINLSIMDSKIELAIMKGLLMILRKHFFPQMNEFRLMVGIIFPLQNIMIDNDKALQRFFA